MKKAQTLKRKPIAVILTDTHMSETNIPIVKSVFKQAAQIAKELGLDQIEHGGDIFHSRKAQTQLVLDSFDDILDELNEEGITLNVVVGNHDKTDYSSHVSFLKQFRHHPFVNIISREGSRPLTNEINLHYLSFFSDDKYLEELKILEAATTTRPVNVLLTHIGVNGATMNNGMEISSNVKPSSFDSFDKVLIGHYHDRSVISDKITYIGSSIQHNYGETPNKGLTVLYDNLTLETKELVFPRYIKYEVDVTKVKVNDITALEEEMTHGDHIRVILTGSEKDIKAFDSQALKLIGIDVKTKEEEIDVEELEQRVEAFDDKSLYAAFIDFCDKQELQTDQGLKYLKSIL